LHKDSKKIIKIDKKIICPSDISRADRYEIEHGICDAYNTIILPILSFIFLGLPAGSHLRKAKYNNRGEIVYSKEYIKGRIDMMKSNLDKSKDRLNNGEITQEEFNILKRDVQNAIKRYKNMRR